MMYAFGPGGCRTDPSKLTQFEFDLANFLLSRGPYAYLGARAGRRARPFPPACWCTPARAAFYSPLPPPPVIRRARVAGCVSEGSVGEQARKGTPPRSPPPRRLLSLLRVPPRVGRRLWRADGPVPRDRAWQRGVRARLDQGECTDGLQDRYADNHHEVVGGALRS